MLQLGALRQWLRGFAARGACKVVVALHHKELSHLPGPLPFASCLQCGLADRALKEGKPALACARLQEALKLLTDAPVGAAS